MEPAVKTHVIVARMPPARRRLRLGVASVVLAGLVVAGCSGDDDKPSSAPSTTTATPAEETTSTTSSAPTTITTVVGTPDENQAIIAAYRSFWDAYIAAANPMNPEHPALAERAVGEELDTVRRTILARKSAGEIFQGTMDLAPKVTSVLGDRATVRDCHDDNLVVLDAATGTVKEPDDPVRKLVSVALVRGDGGVWKVSTIKLEDEGCTA